MLEGETTSNETVGISEDEIVKGSTTQIDLSDRAELVVRIGNEIAIDARRKSKRPGSNKIEVNSGEWNRYNLVVRSIREVVASSVEHGGVNESGMGRLSRLAFIDAMRKLGYSDVNRANIQGNIPRDWYPTDQMSRQFVIEKGKWVKRKAELLALGEELES